MIDLLTGGTDMTTKEQAAEFVELLRECAQGEHSEEDHYDQAADLITEAFERIEKLENEIATLRKRTP